tara:strand:+ start:287 stop:451 length:165 start_codon:yes stop_codon:yes gene_type:complete
MDWWDLDERTGTEALHDSILSKRIGTLALLRSYFVLLRLFVFLCGGAIYYLSTI